MYASIHIHMHVCAKTYIYMHRHVYFMIFPCLERVRVGYQTAETQRPETSQTPHLKNPGPRNPKPKANGKFSGSLSASSALFKLHPGSRKTLRPKSYTPKTSSLRSFGLHAGPALWHEAHAAILGLRQGP